MSNEEWGVYLGNVEWGMKSCEWGNCEWGMVNGEYRISNTECRMRNGEW